MLRVGGERECSVRCPRSRCHTAWRCHARVMSPLVAALARIWAFESSEIVLAGLDGRVGEDPCPGDRIGAHLDPPRDAVGVAHGDDLEMARRRRDRVLERCPGSSRPPPTHTRRPREPRARTVPPDETTQLLVPRREIAVVAEERLAYASLGERKRLSWSRCREAFRAERSSTRPQPPIATVNAASIMNMTVGTAKPRFAGNSRPGTLLVTVAGHTPVTSAPE